MATIHTLLVGRPQQATDDRGTWRSAIFRQPVGGPLELGPRGLAGDEVADKKNHGSPDQAVCCHPLAHYERWNEEYGLSGDAALAPGGVGENWTLAGLSEAEVCVGDIYAVGGARVQVSAPRYPCAKQERKVGLAGFLKRTTATRRTGWYLRVLTPGVVAAGDELALEARPNPGVTIAAVNENMFGPLDPEGSQRLLAVPELAQGWKRIIEMRLAKQT